MCDYVCFIPVGDVNGDGIADIVTAPQSGGAPHVKILDGVDLHVQLSFFAYDSSLRRGVNVAVGDLNNDGTAEIVTAPGAGGGPLVKVFDSAGTKTEVAFASDTSFRAGLAHVSLSSTMMETWTLLPASEMGAVPSTTV